MHVAVFLINNTYAVVAETDKLSEVRRMKREMAWRWHWAVMYSMPKLLWLEMHGRQVKIGVWQVGPGGRTQSLARINLGHEPKFLQEIFRAETMTAIHWDAEFEIHTFWHRQPVKLLQQWCHVVVSTDSMDQSHCHAENSLQSA